MVLLSHPTPAPCGRGTLVGSTARKRRNLGPRDAKEPPEQLQEWACSAGLRMGPSAEILVVVFLLAVSFIGKPPAPAPLHRPGEASTTHVKPGTLKLSAMPFPTSILQPGEESCASRCRGGWGSPITPHPVGEGSAHGRGGAPMSHARRSDPGPGGTRLRLETSPGRFCCLVPALKWNRARWRVSPASYNCHRSPRHGPRCGWGRVAGVAPINLSPCSQRSPAARPPSFAPNPEGFCMQMAPRQGRAVRMEQFCIQP